MTSTPIRTLFVMLLCLSSTFKQGTPQPSLTLEAPNGIALDGRGNVFVSDIGSHRIFKVNSRGELQLFAGTGAAGFSGDNGPAKQATLNSPHDLIYDKEGNLIVADSANHRVRRIDQNGVITTIAGDGKAGKPGYNDPASVSYTHLRAHETPEHLV